MLSKSIHFLKRHPVPFWPLLFLMLFSGCAAISQQPDEALRPPVDAEDVAFQEGQVFFNKGATDQALASFSRYLGQYPQGRHAPAALQRIGDIYRQQGAIDAAQAFYRKAIEQFPDSAAADRARSALIELLIDQNRPAEAADLAAPMLERDLPVDVRHSLWRQLAHLYQISGDVPHSTLYAYLLFRELPPPEKDQWGAALKEMIARLDAAGIEQVWERIDDKQTRSYLMYRYAMIQVLMENDDDALDLLTSFSYAFPNHPNFSEAQDLILTLQRRLSFTPFTLGCLLPLSGSYQAYGQRALNAVEMALNLMQSGETSVPIKLIVEDTGSDDARAVQAVRTLSQAGVGAIIGPIVTAQAASREAQRLNIPIVTFTQKPDITQTGDFVFRHFITPQSQVRALVDYFINDLQLRRFAIMYPDETYGKTFMTLFWDEVLQQGGRLVGVESYAPGQTDFATTIKKLVGTSYPVPDDLKTKPVVQREVNAYLGREVVSPDRLETLVPDAMVRLSGLYFQDQDRSGGTFSARRSKEETKAPIIDFDVIFIPDAPKMAGLILPQLVYHDVKNIYTVGTNLWHSQQLIDMARQYAQEAVLVDGFYKEGSSGVVRKFVDTYRSIFNTDPDLMEAFVFDTANMLFSLLSQTDIRLRSELRNRLRQVSQSDGVTGTTTFAPNGEAIKKLTLLRIKGDGFVEIPRP